MFSSVSYVMFHTALKKVAKSQGSQYLEQGLQP